MYLFPNRLQQAFNRILDTRRVRQTLHKLAPNYGTRRILESCVQRCFVGDAEADEAGISQPHAIDAAEIRLLAVVEALLGAGGGGGGHHVDEAAGVGVDFADAFVGGVGGDEEDQDKAEAVHHGFEFVQIVFHGQVGEDDAVHAGFLAVVAEGFEAVLHHHVEVAHEQHGHGNFRAHAFQLAEQFLQGHAVFEGGIATGLDYRTVGHGVGERDAHFDHVHALGLKLVQDGHRVVQMGVAGGEVDGKDILGFGRKELIDSILHDSEGLDKGFQELGVLVRRAGFELAVHIDANEFGVAERFDSLHIVRADATAQEEGRFTGVAVQDGPIELLAGAARQVAFGVEEISGASALVIVRFLEVLGVFYGKGFPNFEPHRFQFRTGLRRFTAMQLNVREPVFLANVQDVSHRGVYEDGYRFDALRLEALAHIENHHLHKARRFEIKDKAHVVRVQRSHIGDVGRFAHTADLQFQISVDHCNCWIKEDNAAPGSSCFIKFSPMRKPL